MATQNESDRDILIRLDQKVSDIHFNMTQPGGRVPCLETKVEEHGKTLSSLSGAVGMARWIVGIGITLTLGLITLAAALLEHIKGGK